MQAPSPPLNARAPEQTAQNLVSPKDATDKKLGLCLGSGYAVQYSYIVNFYLTVQLRMSVRVQPDLGIINKEGKQ